MRFLSASIICYIVGLLIFYVCAIFDTYAWDVAYFGWNKLFDCGFMFWMSLYLILKEERKVLKWLVRFAGIRFIWDTQSFYTGIGINNEFWMAVLFLILLSITAYFCFLPTGKAATFLSKHLNL